MKAILKNILLFAIAVPLSIAAGVSLGLELGIFLMNLGVNVTDGAYANTLGMVVMLSPILLIQSAIMYMFWSKNETK